MSEGSELPALAEARTGAEFRLGGEPSRLSTLHHERVTLVVDGIHFVVDPALFTAHPDTMLGR